ncbi:AraC family transcriptional regulator [Rheinheimera riviphila]|uniref:AraC family transcriptional regulator n=1 Tax=Rheinheimera riviphila TaxID=1834037 RepID=A0A437QLH2_9GAMM|nr:helix-turn-helix transcriptional regulator [Rheinheimera riviphila]RVU35373.1 AraC family transcriptional regulator [Rheinheimera riviphila]
MTKNLELPYRLVPEWALLQALPKHIHSRFSAALVLLHHELPEALSWRQIAIKCAISPYHFHRQFSELFHETPGRYLSRLRLQQAVSALLLDNHQSVTDIALHCGYSSSQALGKVLKRETGLSASDIRAMAQHATPAETALLLAKLAHPGAAPLPLAAIQKSLSLEQQLAQTMPTELRWYPKRGYRNLPDSSPDWDHLCRQHAEKTLRLVVCTPIRELNLPWNDIAAKVGDWQCDEVLHDHYIDAGYFLCCEVQVVSDSGYSAALEALFWQVEQHQFNINPARQLIEMVRQLPCDRDQGVVFSLQLPVLMA